MNKIQINYQQFNSTMTNFNILNQILKPYEAIIILNPILIKSIEEVAIRFQFEYDTPQTRNQLEYELKELITFFIIENRNKKIDLIL